MAFLRKCWSFFGKWYGTIAVILLNTAIFFLAVNVLCDVVLDAQQYFKKRAAMKGAPYSFRRFHESLRAVHPHLSESEISKLIAETRKLSQGYEAYTQFRENPYATQFVNVDSRGFRPIANQGPWPPKREGLRIFVFGGSTTFGYGVSDRETIASHLQQILQDEGLQTATVYNFGRGSYMSIQERVLFERLLIAGHVPDVAVFIDGLNDLCFYDGEPAYTKDLQRFMAQGDMPLWQRALEELPVMKALRPLFARPEDPRATHARRTFASGQEQEQTLLEFVQRYRNNVKITEAISKAYGVRPVFVWQPVPVHKYDQTYNIFGQFDYDGYIPQLRPGYRLMADLAASGSFGNNFFWCADIQEHVKKPLYVDAIHYSGEMARMIARQIVDTMKQRGLLSSASQPT